MPSLTSSAAKMLDSRGNPTVECDVLLESGVMGRAAVPSGASTGRAKPSSCATATRAATWAGRAQGRRAHQHRNQRGRAGLDASEQAFLDKDPPIDLDGTDNKSRLGANAMLA